MGDFIIRHRWWIIAVTLMIVAASMVFLHRISINPDLESYLPDSMPEKNNTDRMTEIFGASEPLIIVMETQDVLESSTLQRIGNLSRQFRKMKEFSNVISLTEIKNIRGEQGAMIVESAIKTIPSSKEEKETLRNEIKANDLAYKLIVSENFRYTLIILISNKVADDASLMAIVNNKLKEYPGKEKVYINGQPFLRNEANKKIGRDIILLLPVGLLVMTVFLWVSFREKRGVLLPLSVVLISILICMAQIPLFGWQLSLIGVLIPIMMIAIANNYGVYFIVRYQELNARFPETSMHDIVRDSVSFLKRPVTLCGLTTIAGVMGLVAHILLPARQMGIIASIGIGFALILSILFIPSILSILKKGKVQQCFTTNASGFLTWFLGKISGIITAHPKKVIVAFSAFMVFSALGFFWFRVAPDSNRILPAKHQFNLGLNIIDKNFGGNKLVNVLFEGDLKSPEILKRLDYYETELEKLPQVGKVTSLATMIRKMSTALNDPGDELYNKIPDTRESVAQYLELYNMSGNQEDFKDIVDFGYTQGLMTIRFHTSSIKEFKKLMTTINQLIRDDPNMSLIGGFSLIDKKLSESAVDGQYLSLFVAFLAILVLLALIFKSPMAGLLGSLPLAFAVFCILGLMGWIRIELSIVTALLSSVSIGLGVDFTIHVFWRLINELKAGETYSSAIKKMLMATGRGISINAFSVMIGFSVLLLSAFPLIRSFAILIILSLLLCLLCALLLIPAICMVIRPEFLNSHNQISSI